MRLAFWRHQVTGKHALGPAVTAIPTGRSAVATATPAVPVPPPAVAAPAVPLAPTVVRATPPDAVPEPPVARPAPSPAAPPVVAAPTVTAAPVAPPVAAAPRAVAPAPVTPPAPAPLPDSPEALYDEIARMLLTGEAFADPGSADASAVLDQLPPAARGQVVQRLAALRALGPVVAAPAAPVVTPRPVPAQPAAAPDVVLPNQPAPAQVVALPPADVAAPDRGPLVVPDRVPAASPVPSAREQLAQAVAAATGAPPAVPAQERRVELTFRDGSTAALAPSDETFEALELLALSLQQRD